MFLSTHLCFGWNVPYAVVIQFVGREISVSPDSIFKKVWLVFTTRVTRPHRESGNERLKASEPPMTTV